MPLSSFHPAVRIWFEETFEQPTPCQIEAWPAIKRSEHTLIAAPTGSGKTLAAFLASIDNLIHRAQQNELKEQVYIVYVSPLKALSNDIQRTLERPLAAIQNNLTQLGECDIKIRSAVRTGDTPQSQRTAMSKHPPHILVTTPESLYILLTSESGRNMLCATEALIVDEIHAILNSKRGSHLSLSIERLQHLVQKPLIRIGLSATQKPIQRVADFLIGHPPQPADCRIIDSGHLRELDLQLELPQTPLQALLSGEAANEIYDRMAVLVLEHVTTLVFVNTRRMAERVARQLTERLGVEHVGSHHGSLSREQRLDAEQRLKDGQLKVLIATASLELGIDVGDVDLVCQLGSTRSISRFLQRVGRSGHFLGGLPKGRLFPTSRDELLECIALFQAIRQGDLDITHIPEQPLDVLAQQIVAMVGCEEWDIQHLYDVVCRAWPYRKLGYDEFKTVLKMLAEGFTTQRGQRSAYLHWDRINHRLRARRGARLTAITCGGAIPDTAEYRVILEPGEEFIGTVDEDFAIESLSGDIFQLGNSSWKILRIERDKLRVADAGNTPPTIPFWFGEAPGRTHELSIAVCALFSSAQHQLQASENNVEPLTQLLADSADSNNISQSAAQQAANYLCAAHRALGCLPNHNTLILERFFDNSGGMQLILHAPFGSSVNRAWGLALRKNFCRSFNFELQAAATENAIILSLGTNQSFELETVARYLHSSTVRTLLIQAMLDSPMFTVRWRWNASCALAIKRFQGGKKTPPYLLRMQAEDLVTAIFPEQLACLENIQGDREIPDHPLVEQTIKDCLTEAMNLSRLIEILQALENGSMQVIAKDVIEPSPLAAEILTASNYAFLDGAPAEERRTRAASSKTWLNPERVGDLSRVDPHAIQQAVQRRKPSIRTADELCDLLDSQGFVSIPSELEQDWGIVFDVLLRQGRATRLIKPGRAQMFWVSAQRLDEMRSIHPQYQHNPELLLPIDLIDTALDRKTAIVNILRSRLATSAPLNTEQLAHSLDISIVDANNALLQLENEGYVLRGHWNSSNEQTKTITEWCERSLLNTSHRHAIQLKRKTVQSVSTTDFFSFLFDWQHLTANHQYRGAQTLSLILDQLQGYQAPMSVWQQSLINNRITDFSDLMFWLDSLTSSGQYQWLRLDNSTGSHTLTSHTPITFVPRHALQHWQSCVSSNHRVQPSASAQQLISIIQDKGALFYDQLQTSSGFLQSQLDNALGELVALGLISCDQFSGLTRLLAKPVSRNKKHKPILAAGGRWSILFADSQLNKASSTTNDADLNYLARSLLQRYGIIFKTLLTREICHNKWQQLLPILQRMEWSGEIRCGRFVNGQYGQQFALPEAVQQLQKQSATDTHPESIIINATDPLNLVGILTAEEKISAVPGNRILFQQGKAIASLTGNNVVFLTDVKQEKQWDIQNSLIRNTVIPHQPSSLQYQ
ncbi:MAG TPA: DEAD/DEAH box helicase [Crenotrichaceae bacterium]|nr:DEAD/DEAH box helicase [Crenotrichaceae bacterium]